MMDKEVVMVIKGGMAVVIKQPEGVDVHIRDYDIDNLDDDDTIDIQIDDDGNKYVFACDCCN